MNDRIDNITIEGGTGISVTKQGDNYTIVNTAPDTGDTNTITTISAGDGISISDNGTAGNHNYTITATSSGNSECCDQIKDRIDNITIEGGTGISVTKNGDNYTIVNTAPDTGDTNTVTTITAGDNISIVDNGTGGNHNYVITGTGGGDSGTDTNTITTLVAGDGISITDNGTGYTIVNTAPDTGDTNTVTTITAGDGISIVDGGIGGNHNYTITAECCDQLNDRIDNITIEGGTGISVTKQGDNYTIINTSPGTDVTVPNEVEVVSVSPNIIVTKKVV